MLDNFKRLKEKTTIAGISGVLGSALGVPYEYMDPFEALITAIISALFIAYGPKEQPAPEGGTVDPIPKD